MASPFGTRHDPDGDAVPRPARPAIAGADSRNRREEAHLHSGRLMRAPSRYRPLCASAAIPSDDLTQLALEECCRTVALLLPHRPAIVRQPVVRGM
jgi:hypothetical protein